MFGPSLPRTESANLSQFQFDEPLAAPAGTPANLFSYTLATTYIVLDHPGHKVWLNATIRWYATFTAVGSTDVTFTIYRDGMGIFSVTQSVFNPTATPKTISNVAHIQYVDTPLWGSTGPFPLAVTYSVSAGTESAGPVFASGPAILSVVEVESGL